MAAVVHVETGRDMISRLPVELKLEIISGLPAAEIVGLQSLSKEWLDLVRTNEYILAKKIGDRENSRLRRVIEKCDIRGLDPLAALMRYDELFNVYDMSGSPVNRAKQYAFAHAYALAASKDLGLLEDVADAMYTAASVLFNQHRFARSRGWRNTVFTQQSNAHHKIWDAEFRHMGGAGDPCWDTLQQTPETVRAMCFWASAARPFGAVPYTHDERIKTALTPSKRDGALRRPFTSHGLPLTLWDTPLNSMLALPHLPANWLFRYVVTDPDDRYYATSRPLRDAHLQESTKIELFLDEDTIVVDVR